MYEKNNAMMISMGQQYDQKVVQAKQKELNMANKSNLLLSQQKGTVWLLYCWEKNLFPSYNQPLRVYFIDTKYTMEAHMSSLSEYQ